MNNTFHYFHNFNQCWFYMRPKVRLALTKPDMLQEKWCFYIPSYFDKLKFFYFAKRFAKFREALPQIREALPQISRSASRNSRSASPISRSASRNSRSASSKGFDKFKSNWYLYRWQYDLSINSLGDRSASRHFGKRFTNFAKRFAKFGEALREFREALREIWGSASRNSRSASRIWGSASRNFAKRFAK